MKIFLLCAVIWLSILSLASYFIGILLVYFILLGILIGITLEADLIPWRAKKLPEPEPQYSVIVEEREAA